MTETDKRMAEPPFEPFRLANPALDLLTCCAEVSVKAWQLYQVEGASFAAKRMRKNLEHGRCLRHCGDPSEMARAQQAWMGELAADYAEETGRLVGAAFELATGLFQPPRAAEGAKRPKAAPEAPAGAGAPRVPLAA